MRSLVTGVGGFAGRHLAHHLLAKGEQVTGVCFDAADVARLGPLRKRIGAVRGDIRDLRQMRSILRRARPDVVYHLAAQASVSGSLDRPIETVDINVTGTAGVLEAVRVEAPGARVLFPSSSDVYGRVRPQDVPIRESHPVAPRNPYAASKVACEELCRQYARAYDLHVVIARSFNHTGPGQGTGFVVPDFASQIARIETGRGRARIKVGNLSARRDVSDVRDIVRGYRLLVRKGRKGEIYHLGSGRDVRIGDLLDFLLGLAIRPIEIVTDPERQRPSDLPVLAAALGKTRRQTGWRVTIPLERTLEDTLNYWRTYDNAK